MAKRYDEPIEVTADPADSTAPSAFEWRGRRYDIDQRLASWREAGEWWNGYGHTAPLGTNGDRSANVRDREFFRVLARPSESLATGDLDADGFLRSKGAVYDVYRDLTRNCWRIARLWD
jgi:Domain of unknown function (DUF6504)